MKPLKHIIFGALFTLLVYLVFPWLGWNVLIIFAASVLVDIDHYFIAVMITGNWCPFKAYKFFKKIYHDGDIVDGKDLTYELYIFHTFEFYILLFILSFSNVVFLLILGGISIHVFLDLFNPIEKKRKSVLSYMVKKRVNGQKK